MCGICGVKRFGDTPIDQAMIDMLILHNSNRGIDAAGVALQQEDGTVNVFKQDITPYQFVSGFAYREWMKANLKPTTLIAIGHTRKATKGNPINNENNHPMFSGTTAVVHNGMIHNDDELFKEWKLERKAETDSDIFRAVFDKEGFTAKAINMCTRMHGNAAFAAVNSNYPGKLLLARSGNPVELLANDDFMMFSSERGPLYRAIRPYRPFYGVNMREMSPKGYGMIGMEDHSAWLLAEKPIEGNGSEGDWLEWHQEMHISYNFTPAHYQCSEQYYGSRVKFYNDQPVEIVCCPGCQLYIVVPPSNIAKLKLIKCGVCKSALA